jgi:hypothetical protein
MEDGGAFGRREAGQVEFLEGGRGNCRNLRPRIHRRRSGVAPFAKATVGRDVLELEREEFEGEGVELSVGQDGTRLGAKFGEARLQPGGETGKWISCVHAVLVEHRLVVRDSRGTSV